MNRDSNKRGRGKAPKKGGHDFGRNTYIEQIITRDELEASSRAAMMAGTQTKSEGQSIEQPILSTVPLVDLMQQTLPAVEEVCSSVPDEGVPLLVTEEEEVASRRFEEPVHSSREG